jgi:N-methylhydantoinase A
VLLGVDVGGTFTDAVLIAGADVCTAKVPSTPGDESRGVLAAVAAVIEDSGREPAEVARFAHGMTVATNALLEGRGARTALIATEGFADVVELARQARPSLYRLCQAPPAPLVGPELRFEARERTGPDGPLRPLAAHDGRALVEAVAAAEPEAVAVVLLHSYADPGHELAIASLLAERLPDVHVSLSHDVVGTFREYERAATTEVDAALSPLIAGYLSALGAGTRAAGLPEPAIMQSSGGLASAERAAAHAALTVLSGPAGGAGGALLLAERAGVEDVLCFDMGGTSCDVCVIEAGRVRETAEREVGGRPLALPMLDIHTVGAGGGSIAWRDAGGALRVGPASAGAVPGPACYGRGGTEPTVTDANLLLGRLPAAGLAGGVSLDRAAAEQAVTALAATLGLDSVACAQGIVRVADAEMLRALRVMTVNRGIDPRRFTLMPFGGAGPLHAAAIAEELGIASVLCPRASGVLSALGLAAAAPRRDAARTVLLCGPAFRGDAVARVAAGLLEEAASGLADEVARTRVLYELRYRGQSFELAVEGAANADADALRDAFADEHEERYGYRDPDGEVELVTVRASAWGPTPELRLQAPAGDAPQQQRQPAVFGGRELDAVLWSGAPPPGTRIAGPAICALAESTVVVPPGWEGQVDAQGSILLHRNAARAAP